MCNSLRLTFHTIFTAITWIFTGYLTGEWCAQQTHYFFYYTFRLMVEVTEVCKHWQDNWKQPNVLSILYHITQHWADSLETTGWVIWVCLLFSFVCFSSPVRTWNLELAIQIYCTFLLVLLNFFASFSLPTPKAKLSGENSLLFRATLFSCSLRRSSSS